LKTTSETEPLFNIPNTNEKERNKDIFSNPAPSIQTHFKTTLFPIKESSEESIKNESQKKEPEGQLLSSNIFSNNSLFPKETSIFSSTKFDNKSVQENPSINELNKSIFGGNDKKPEEINNLIKSSENGSSNNVKNTTLGELFDKNSTSQNLFSKDAAITVSAPLNDSIFNKSTSTTANTTNNSSFTNLFGNTNTSINTSSIFGNTNTPNNTSNSNTASIFGKSTSNTNSVINSNVTTKPVEPQKNNLLTNTPPPVKSSGSLINDSNPFLAKPDTVRNLFNSPPPDSKFLYIKLLSKSRRIRKSNEFKKAKRRYFRK